MIFDPLERFLSSMAIFIIFFCGLFYFSKGFKKHDKNEKILMVGFGAFWFFIALTRLFFFISDYILEGTYIGDLYVIILTYDVINYLFLYFYLYLYNYIFVIATIVIILFTWSSFKSTREFQAISSAITVGFATFLIGWGFDSIIVKNSKLFTPALSPVFMIMGISIVTSPLIGHFELFSKKIVKLFIVIVICLLVIFITTILLLNLQLASIFLIIIGIALSMLILIISYIIYFYVKSGERVIKEEELQDTLKTFTKPLKFSVEDVKYSKEKGYCLVCKNKISGFTYVCPKCQAWYCLNCYKALSEIENACWGCETAFTKFKPIKNL